VAFSVPQTEYKMEGKRFQEVSQIIHSIIEIKHSKRTVPDMLQQVAELLELLYLIRRRQL
jgi:hypothetical protein